MSETCKAVVFSGKDTWDIREYPIPGPPHAGAVLQVEAVGMCHSDVDMFHGITHTPNAVFPAVPGHETVGRIHSITPEAATSWGVSVGDRVALNSVLRRDGDLHVYGHDFSADEFPGLCGGYGEYMVLFAGTEVHKLRRDKPPDELTFFNPLTAAVGWVGPVAAGDVFVVQGPGHMGLACVIAAKLAGAKTIIVTGTGADGLRLATAREIGADYVINVDAQDPVEMVRTITGGAMADVVLDAAAQTTRTVLLAFELVRRGGIIVLGGLKDHKPIDGIVTDDIVLRHLVVQGAVGGAVKRAVELINADMVPTDKVKGATFSLETVEEALAALDRKGLDAVRVNLRMA